MNSRRPIHVFVATQDKIARMVRVWYSRRLLNFRRAHKFRTEKEIPAATIIQVHHSTAAPVFGWCNALHRAHTACVCVLVQRFQRGAMVRKVVRTMRLRNAAVKVIQRSYRNALGIREARALWRRMREEYVNRMAARLQAVYRGFLARREARLRRQYVCLWAGVLVHCSLIRCSRPCAVSCVAHPHTPPVTSKRRTYLLLVASSLGTAGTVLGWPSARCWSCLASGS